MRGGRHPSVWGAQPTRLIDLHLRAGLGPHLGGQHLFLDRKEWRPTCIAAVSTQLTNCCGMGELPNRCGSIQLIQPVVGIAGTHLPGSLHLFEPWIAWNDWPAHLDVGLTQDAHQGLRLARHEALVCPIVLAASLWYPHARGSTSSSIQPGGLHLFAAPDLWMAYAPAHAGGLGVDVAYWRRRWSTSVPFYLLAYLGAHSGCASTSDS